MHRLESPSMRLDPTIRHLPLQTMRQNPDLRRYLRELGIPPLNVLAYEALAEGPYGMVRVAALVVLDPFRGGPPEVFALDGERRSLHRNPPWDNDVEGVGGHLCLYFPRDPDERRWTVDYGLIGLFDLARRHLLCEHIWRLTDEWPTEDAPHGFAARPVPARPELKVPFLRETAVGDR
jgi:hypothetical protein